MLRHWGKRGLLVLVGLFGLWMAASSTSEVLMLHPRHWGVGPPPSARGWAYQDVAFKDPAGLTLRGWWIPGTNGATVVMVHGWTSSRREPYDKSQYLHDAGYNLLVFDLRGHGLSDGGYTTMGWREPEDVRAAVTLAKSLDPGPVALLGYSMGGASVLEEAAGDPRVAAVIEDSAFSSLSSVVAADFQHLTHLPAQPFDWALLFVGQQDLHFQAGWVQPVRAAAQLRQPLLAIIGSADTTVPPAEGWSIYGAAAGPKQLLLVPGAGHTQAYNVAPAAYKAAVLGFLSRWLQPAAASGQPA